jgi:hypothetical protein
VSTTPRGFARLYDVGAPRPGDPVKPTPTNLGGTFTTAPAAIALTPNRLDVFGLSTDYNVYHKTGTVGTGTAINGKRTGTIWAETSVAHRWSCPHRRIPSTSSGWAPT